MHFRQYEFDTPPSAVGDDQRTDSEVDTVVGGTVDPARDGGFDDFQFGATVPQLSLIPGLEVDDDQWQDRALCSQTDPEAFFPEKGGSTREAKRICMGCEVRGECLDYALANDERFGIWGGLSERERRRLKRGII